MTDYEFRSHVLKELAVIKNEVTNIKSILDKAPKDRQAVLEEKISINRKMIYFVLTTMISLGVTSGFCVIKILQ